MGVLLRGGVAAVVAVTGVIVACVGVVVAGHVAAVVVVAQ